MKLVLEVSPPTLSCVTHRRESGPQWGSLAFVACGTWCMEHLVACHPALGSVLGVLSIQLSLALSPHCAFPSYIFSLLKVSIQVPGFFSAGLPSSY